MCHKKQSSTFIHCITTVPSLQAQIRKIMCWAEYGKKINKKVNWVKSSVACLVKKWWVFESLCSFSCPQDQVSSVGEDEKPKSTISSYVGKDTNCVTSVCVHAWMFTECYQNWRKVERCPFPLTQETRASTERAGERLIYKLLTHSPKSSVFLYLPFSFLRKYK